MQYMKIYDSLISTAKKARRSKTNGIYELHHIIPKCLGGDNTEINLVLLTPREHFIAHMLLWKNDRANYKLLAPLLFFKKSKHVKNARTFQFIREQHVNVMRSCNPSLTLSAETKKRKSLKLSEYASNRSAETRTKISNSNKGKQKRLGAVLGESSKLKIANSLLLFYANNEVSIETRTKISNSNKGRTHSDETKNKWSNAAKRRLKFSCPICKDSILTYDGGNFNLHMKRFHSWDSNTSTEYKTSIKGI